MTDELKVKDAMTKKIITIKSDETVLEAAKAMETNRVGSLIVTTNEKPVGIITESDIIKKIVSKNILADNIKISDIASKPIIFSSPEERLSDAAAKMITNKVRRLAVIDNGELVGILTHTDIAQNMPSMVTLLSERVKMRRSDHTVIDRYIIGPTMSGSVAGLCEVCGNYSESLKVFDDEWLCGSCHKEKTNVPGAKWQRKPGFKEWSRMG